jgi:hypothetical protein
LSWKMSLLSSSVLSSLSLSSSMGRGDRCNGKGLRGRGSLSRLDSSGGAVIGPPRATVYRFRGVGLIS